MKVIKQSYIDGYRVTIYKLDNILDTNNYSEEFKKVKP